MLDKKLIKIIGDTASKNMFIQLVDDHDMELMDTEAVALKNARQSTDWCIAAVPVSDWNHDLTPWRAEPVYGKQEFGDGAEQTLRELIEDIVPELQQKYPVSGQRLYLCGYSLAGLFVLWAAYQTDRFAGIVAASPSVWYKDWTQYASRHTVKIPKIYLSLGDKEEKAKNPTMASVGNAIREQYKLLLNEGTVTQLDFNPGNHFVDSDVRTAKGMAWMLRATE